MCRCFPGNARRLSVKQLLRRGTYLVTCSFAISIFWMQLNYIHTKETEDLLNEALENVAKDSRYSEVLRKQSKLAKDVKYILLWSDYDFAPFYFFEEGQRSFIKNNCSSVNCYVTTNRQLLNDEITNFHAVAFNGRTLSVQNLPTRRSPFQKYVFFNMESSDNGPVCDEKFDGYFNWTATYKLTSDIVFPYIMVKNKQGKIVGPRINMAWPENISSTEDKDMASRLTNKTKAAAWFVSHCFSRGGRDNFVKRLQKALELYNLTVDIYGSCGTLQCPRAQENTCNSLLEKDYFFYMSLENSLAEDYITEKLLTGLQHATVPIVYGGANYSRFLPPGSYLDSRNFDVYQLAATMYQLMRVPELYTKFFRWKNLYTYSNPTRTENICNVCAALNDKEKFETATVYSKFRKWWNPKYRSACRRVGKG